MNRFWNQQKTYSYGLLYIKYTGFFLPQLVVLSVILD